MIAIVDYGVGNLFSLHSSLAAIGAESIVTGDAAAISKADAVILPGVGAFEDAAAKLRETGLAAAVRGVAASGKPLLGICLGMQLLFEQSFEFGEHEGLGLLPGSVVPMAGVIPAELKIPHIGWNALHLTPAGKNSPLFANVHGGEYVYFVHSYYATGCGDALLAVTDYGADLTAAVGQGNVLGCQFHPEKSGTVGLGILRAFCAMGGRV